MSTTHTANKEGSHTNGSIEDAIEQLKSTRKKIHSEGEWAENFHWYDDRVDELDDVIQQLKDSGADDDSLRGSSGEPLQDDETAVSSELPEITRHVEPPEYGGETYARCEGCGVECVGGPDRILHDNDCPHLEDRR